MTALRSFATLSQEAIAIAARGRATLAALLFGRGNAQYERLVGDAPPNAGRNNYAGHDHAGLGGVALPRGTRYGFDVGDNTSQIQIQIDGVGKAFNVRHPLITNRDVDFFCSVSERLTGNAVGGSACKMIGRILVDVVSTAGTITFTLYNYNTNTRTTGVTKSTTGLARLFWLDVPIEPGSRNGFAIEVEANAASTVEVLSILLAETRTQSQPAQNGTVFSSVGRPS